MFGKVPASVMREKRGKGARIIRRVQALINPKDQILKQCSPRSSTQMRENPQEQLSHRISNSSILTTFMAINHLLLSPHPPPLPTQRLFPACTRLASPPALQPSTPLPPHLSLPYTPSANPCASYSSTPTSSSLNPARSCCTPQYSIRYIVPRSQRRGKG